MASVSFWADPDLESELVWNQVRLDDVVLPGLARVRGTLKADIEAKKSKGNDGADYSDNGLVPCDFTIELQMWEAIQWDAYQALLPRLLPRKRGAARKLWTVQHPACQLMGVAKVYIHEFPFPEPDDDGVVRVALKVLEYIPAPKPVKPVKPAVDPGDPESRSSDYLQGAPRQSYGEGSGDVDKGAEQNGRDDGAAAGSSLGSFAGAQAAKDAGG
jgi:hypothetical protein